MRVSRRTLLTSAVVLPVVACGRENARTLLWSEEFDTLDLASPTNRWGKWRPNDVWQPLDQGYVDFASDTTWAVNPAQQIPGVASPFSISESVLRITTTRTPPEVRKEVEGCPWLGGVLVSNTLLPKMTFGYGYYEFRARFPTVGRGMFPAMWFYSARGLNPGKPRAEIDLFEVFGEAEGKPWRSTLHSTSLVNVQTQNLDTTDWHTYGVHWTEDKIDFYYDGRRTARAPSEDVKFFQGTSMSIRTNFVMDAEYFPPDRTSDLSTPDTLHMDIDYIRQYDKP